MKYSINYSRRFIIHLKTVFQTFNGFLVIASRYSRNKFKRRSKHLLEGEVTLIITSCNRIDNLKKTVISFLEYNTFNIKYLIHIEDGQCKQSVDFVKISFPGCNIVSIFNDKNIGQLNSIDLAYSMIQTEFFFHLEDDWSFKKFGFIEFSLNVLRNHQNILYVSLRSYDDQNNHPLLIYNNEFLTYKPFWRIVWFGFGFNPSLRRTSDYLMISKFGGLNKRETGIGLFYYLILNKVVVIPKNYFFVEHNGWLTSTFSKYSKA